MKEHKMGHFKDTKREEIAELDQRVKAMNQRLEKIVKVKKQQEELLTAAQILKELWGDKYPKKEV
jgi:Tfp pilus assembly protein PilN